jgi:hypothetical protein
LKEVKRVECKIIDIFINILPIRDDLLYYMGAYKHLMGNPNLVICLDAGAISRDTLSITSSLRGCLSKFIVEILIGFRL